MSSILKAITIKQNLIYYRNSHIANINYLVLEFLLCKSSLIHIVCTPYDYEVKHTIEVL